MFIADSQRACMYSWKYGISFLTAAVLLAIAAFTRGGIWWVCLWPALSFGVVGVAYLGAGTVIFGKRSDGSLSVRQVFLLFPFLLYMWGVWHLVRLLSREPAYNQLIDGWLIGRRLLAHELPDDVTRVIDLTAEFSEPRRLRENTDYHSLPILDAAAPSDEILDKLVRLLLARSAGVTFVHCAQGHGRTAFCSALLLLTAGRATTADEALQLVQQSRPLARLNPRQRQCLEMISSQLTGRIEYDSALEVSAE